VVAVFPPRNWNKSSPCEFAAASAFASEIAKAVFPPMALKLVVPSISWSVLSISSWKSAFKPASSGAMRSSIFLIAESTPFWG